MWYEKYVLQVWENIDILWFSRTASQIEFVEVGCLLSLSCVDSWSKIPEVLTLVGGWTTHLKNMIVKLDHFPKNRRENEQYLSCHHLAHLHPPGMESVWPHATGPKPHAGEAMLLDLALAGSHIGQFKCRFGDSGNMSKGMYKGTQHWNHLQSTSTIYAT